MKRKLERSSDNVFGVQFKIALTTANRPVPLLHRALVVLGTGDLEAALELLEEGFAERCSFDFLVCTVALAGSGRKPL